MQLKIYQWLGPLIALIFIYRTIKQYRLHHRSLRATLIWIAFWVALIILSLIPDEFSNRIAGTLGFKSNINAVLFTGLGFLFLITFYLSDALHNLESKMTDLVRELAIERAEKKDGREGKEKKTEQEATK